MHALAVGIEWTHAFIGSGYRVDACIHWQWVWSGRMHSLAVGIEWTHAFIGSGYGLVACMH
jgi:hypothetical protein